MATDNKSQVSPKRKQHRRVVRQGTERFTVEGDYSPQWDREVDTEKKEDKYILRELPPHWGTFDLEKNR